MAMLAKADRIVFIIGLIYFAAFLIAPARFGGVAHNEDPMAPSGFAVLLVTVYIARRVQNGFQGRFDGLLRGGVLLASDFGAELRRRFARICLMSSVGTAVVLIPLTAVGVWLANAVPDGKLHLTLGSIAGAFLVANRFGWAIATGLLPIHFKKAGVDVVLTRNAADKSSGLLILGEFYFRQAVIVLIPTVYMLFWFYVIEKQFPFAAPYFCHVDVTPAAPCPPEYVDPIWTGQFVRLILFNILIVFSLAVLVPALALRGAMRDYKARYFLPLVAPLEDELARLRRQTLAFGAVSSARDQLGTLGALHGQIEAKAGELASYRDAPTWPLPLWETLVAIVSNVSAVTGLIGFGVL